MEVYIENCLKGASKWIRLPMARLKLMSEIDKISEDGEYQLTRIKINDFNIQECVGNIYALNDKIQIYNTLSDSEKDEINVYAEDTGLSFEEALYIFC